MCLDSVNAAYAAVMLNADMVNPKPWWQKQAGFRQKNRETGRFLSSKNYVKYNPRFFINAGTVHFYGGCDLGYKNYRYISIDYGEVIDF